MRQSSLLLPEGNIMPTIKKTTKKATAKKATVKKTTKKAAKKTVKDVKVHVNTKAVKPTGEVITKYVGDEIEFPAETEEVTFIGLTGDHAEQAAFILAQTPKFLADDKRTMVQTFRACKEINGLDMSDIADQIEKMPSDVWNCFCNEYISRVRESMGFGEMGALSRRR